MKVLKGLTKELIKASKNKNLLFTKEELNNIKNSAEVTYKKEGDTFRLSVWTKYGESCCGAYIWRGEFAYYGNGTGRMEIFSGFTANPIGQIRNIYTCERPYGTNYKEEFALILKYMADARESSKRADRAYCDYVARTGDLS